LAQRTTNLYRLVTYPVFYKTLMLLLGSDRSRRRFANEILKATPDMKMLDVGCGPASILDYLPPLNYTGIDLNEKHIVYARERYADRGRFMVGDAGKDLKQEEGSFDLINVSALLHHISDEEARTLFRSLKPLLKSGGRIVTFDNVWLPNQRAIVKFINKMDSGLNIRTPEEYLKLLDGFGFEAQTHTYHDLLRIPYDHFIMVVRKA
jgi:SAM-dependent methyltransferase